MAAIVRSSFDRAGRPSPCLRRTVHGGRRAGAPEGPERQRRTGGGGYFEAQRSRGSRAQRSEHGGENSRRSRFRRDGDRHRSTSRSRRMGACNDGGSRPQASGSIKRGRRLRASIQAGVPAASARNAAKERPTRAIPRRRAGRYTGQTRVGTNRNENAPAVTAPEAGNAGYADLGRAVRVGVSPSSGTRSADRPARSHRNRSESKSAAGRARFRSIRGALTIASKPHLAGTVQART